MTNPIRVLCVLGALDIGGAENRTMDIYRGIDRSRIQFDFMVHTQKIGHYESEIHMLGGRVYRTVPRFKVYNYIKYRKEWKKFLTDNFYSTIHIMTYNTALPILQAAIQAGVKTRIVHSRNSKSMGIWRSLVMRISRPFIRRLATHRLAVSDPAGRHVFGKCYDVKPNGVDVNVFRFDSVRRAKMRQQWGVEESFVLGAVARLVPVKNHSFMFHVFAQVVKAIPDAVLFLVGDGDYMQALKKQVANMKLDDRIFFVGARKDVPDLLQCFDVFLMPSKYEGFPGAALEAQAAGLPALLSDTITSEVNVVKNLVTYLPINMGTQPWIQVIIDVFNSQNTRSNNIEDIINAGYGVQSVIKWYEELYTSD